MSQETVLITGASSGIGLELARLFAADGSKLILVARREDKLLELAGELESQHGVEVVVISKDLSEPKAADELYQTIKDQGDHVDVLVNNAGFGQHGDFTSIPLERHLNMLQVNINSLVHLTQLFLEDMKERQSGAILNLGSTASFQPGPYSSVYYATKAFVLSFSEALYGEAQSYGVLVSVLCPGPTKTGFGDDSDMEDTLMFKYNSMDVKAVAVAGHQGIRKRKRLVMPGMINNYLAWCVRFAPRRFMIRLMSFLQKPKEA